MEEEQTILSPSYGLLPGVHQPPQLVGRGIHVLCRFLGMLSPRQRSLPDAAPLGCQEHRSAGLNPAQISYIRSSYPLPCRRCCKEPSYLLGPKGCFLPQKPNLEVRLPGLEPDVWQVQEQSLCLRVNFNFCGFFFLKHGVGTFHVNTSGKKNTSQHYLHREGNPRGLLLASDMWGTAGFTTMPEQITWFSEVLCL